MEEGQKINFLSSSCRAQILLSSVQAFTIVSLNPDLLHKCLKQKFLKSVINKHFL